MAKLSNHEDSFGEETIDGKLATDEIDLENSSEEELIDDETEEQTNEISENPIAVTGYASCCSASSSDNQNDSAFSPLCEAAEPPC